MQQTVEGVQVRNVVGQAIVLYAKDVPPQTTLPSNLNGSAGQAARTGVAGANSALASQGVAGENQGVRLRKLRSLPAKPQQAVNCRLQEG